MSGKIKREFNSRRRRGFDRLSPTTSSIARTSTFLNYTSGLPETFTDSPATLLLTHNGLWRGTVYASQFASPVVKEEDLVIAGNRVTSLTPLPVFAYFKAQLESDHYVETSAFLNPLGVTRQFRLFTKFRDDANGAGPYYIALDVLSQFGDQTYINLYHVDHQGTATPFGNQYTTSVLTENATYKLGVRKQGDSYTGYFNGVAITEGTFAEYNQTYKTHPVGYAGFCALTDDQIYFDDFSVTGAATSNNILEGVATSSFAHTANLTANQKPMTVKRTAIEFNQDMLTDDFNSYSTGELELQSSLKWTKNTNISATPLINVTSAGRIRSGAADATANVQAYRWAASAPYRADYSVTGYLYIATLPTVGSFGAAISARQFGSTSGRYRLLVVVTSTGDLSVYLYATSTPIGIRTNYLTGVTAGQSYRLRLSCEGTTIKGFIDDIELFSVTNASLLTAGTAGVEFVNSTGTDVPADGTLLQFSAMDVTSSVGVSTLINQPSPISATTALTFGQSGTLRGTGALAKTEALTFSHSASIRGLAEIYVVYPDTFTDTDGVLLVNHDARWVKHGASSGAGIDAEILSNRVRGEIGNLYYTNTYQSSGADYSVRADFYINDNPDTNTHWAGVMGRHDPTSKTGYYATINKYAAGQTEFKIEPFINGTGQPLVGGGSYVFNTSVGNTINIELLMNGTTIQGYVNGVLRINGTDSSVAAQGRGGILFETEVDTWGHYHADNFAISPVSASMPALVFGQTGTLTSASAGQISGTTSLTFGQSGTLRGVGSIADTEALTFNQSGSLRGIGLLADTEALTFGQSGNLIGIGSIADTEALTFGQSGTLRGVGSIAKTEPIVFGHSATLHGNGLISANVSLVFGQSGNLIGSGLVGTTTLFIINQSGLLLGNGLIAANVPLVFDQTGTLTSDGSGQISGTINLTFNQSTTLTGIGLIADTEALVFNQSATLNGVALVAANNNLTFNQFGQVVGFGSLTANNSLVIGTSANATAIAFVSGSSSVSFNTASSLASITSISGSSSLIFNQSGSLVARGLVGTTTLFTINASGALGATVNISGVASVTFDANCYTTPQVKADLGGTVKNDGYYRFWDLLPELEKRAVPNVPLKIIASFKGETQLTTTLSTKKPIRMSIQTVGKNDFVLQSGQSISTKINGNVDISATLRFNYLTVLADDEIELIMSILASKRGLDDALVNRTIRV